MTVDCERCDGTGVIIVVIADDEDNAECPWCDGTGQIEIPEV